MWCEDQGGDHNNNNTMDKPTDTVPGSEVMINVGDLRGEVVDHNELSDPSVLSINSGDNFDDINHQHNNNNDNARASQFVPRKCRLLL